MADSYSSKLQIWDGWLPAFAVDAPATFAGVRPDAGLAERLRAAEALGPISSAAADAYSLQWFLDVEHARYQRNGRWIPRLLEFAKHTGETLLGLGSGLGTDWVQYARHGAAVVACGPSAERLALVQRNFELRGLGGRFLHVYPAHLPLESASIDVACVSTLLTELGEPAAILDELYRVLKPGGKVLAVALARYDLDYWRRFLPWPRRVAADDAPHFSARRLRRLFSAFVEHRVHKRHLRRADIPRPCRWLPRAMLERAFGRLLVLKAFKPLSAALPIELAA